MVYFATESANKFANNKEEKTMDLEINCKQANISDTFDQDLRGLIDVLGSY
jgi:hypothetical protein